MKTLLLIICSAGLLTACDTYSDDYHRGRHHAGAAVYREDYYGGAPSYGYTRRAYSGSYSRPDYYQGYYPGTQTYSRSYHRGYRAAYW